MRLDNADIAGLLIIGRTSLNEIRRWLYDTVNEFSTDEIIRRWVYIWQGDMYADLDNRSMSTNWRYLIYTHGIG